jgi:hypothetical protein
MRRHDRYTMATEAQDDASWVRGVRQNYGGNDGISSIFDAADINLDTVAAALEFVRVSARTALRAVPQLDSGAGQPGIDDGGTMDPQPAPAAAAVPMSMPPSSSATASSPQGSGASTNGTTAQTKRQGRSTPQRSRATRHGTIPEFIHRADSAAPNRGRASRNATNAHNKRYDGASAPRMGQSHKIASRSRTTGDDPSWRVKRSAVRPQSASAPRSRRGYNTPNIPDANSVVEPGVVVDVGGGGNCCFLAMDVCMFAADLRADHSPPALSRHAMGVLSDGHATLRANLCDRIGLRDDDPMRMTSTMGLPPRQQMANYASLYEIVEMGHQLRAHINIIAWAPRPLYLAQLHPAVMTGNILYNPSNGGNGATAVYSAWDAEAFDFAELTDVYGDGDQQRGTIVYYGEEIPNVMINNPTIVNAESLDECAIQAIVGADLPTYNLVFVSNEMQHPSETDATYTNRLFRANANLTGHFMALIPGEDGGDPLEQVRQSFARFNPV